VRELEVEHEFLRDLAAATKQTLSRRGAKRRKRNATKGKTFVKVSLI
jgi:hypothetical protein